MHLQNPKSKTPPKNSKPQPGQEATLSGIAISHEGQFFSDITETSNPFMTNAKKHDTRKL